MTQLKRERKKAFTLIELIIVVVIISILALVAIPRYFANVAKAQKSQVYANLDAIRQADLAYYAAFGVYKSSFPINVTLDGDTIINISNLTNEDWRYTIGTSATCSSGGDGYHVAAYKQPDNTCYYALCMSGFPYQSCTP
ncbi:MAG: prepilin-type N-terminal cleavage/methylation domain-containing protein [Candidatus Omnitrophota bacterium]|jgi:prepilin-type N-terminal cleavage/methylation domain-containing protein